MLLIALPRCLTTTFFIAAFLIAAFPTAAFLTACACSIPHSSIPCRRNFLIAIFCLGGCYWQPSASDHPRGSIQFHSDVGWRRAIAVRSFRSSGAEDQMASRWRQRRQRPKSHHLRLGNAANFGWVSLYWFVFTVTVWNGNRLVFETLSWASPLFQNYVNCKMGTIFVSTMSIS